MAKANPLVAVAAAEPAVADLLAAPKAEPGTAEAIRDRKAAKAARVDAAHDAAVRIEKASAPAKAKAPKVSALDRCRKDYGVKGVERILALYTSEMTGSQIDKDALGSKAPARPTGALTGYASFRVYRAAGLDPTNAGRDAARKGEGEDEVTASFRRRYASSFVPLARPADPLRDVVLMTAAELRRLVESTRTRVLVGEVDPSLAIRTSKLAQVHRGVLGAAVAFEPGPFVVLALRR